jgi:uncharacterized protein Yka (UPF0111/DUF47 family)
LKFINRRTSPRKSTDFRIWSKNQRTAVRLLKTYKKSQKDTHEVINRINACEKECDLLYIQSMRDLYQSNADSVNIFILSKIYKSLEDCCDAFKDVTKLVEEIVLKYV